jgi:hypothetical protein
MGIKETLLKAKKNVRSRVENVLGREPNLEPSAVRQEILDQVRSKIIDDSGSRLFPFGKVIVRMTPQTETQKDAIHEALLMKDTLKTDILQMLQEAKAQYPNEFEALIELGESRGNDRLQTLTKPVFEVDFIRTPVLPNQKAPETKLRVIKGVTEKPEYALNKHRILIGRSPEVLDREGRIVRRNDVVFLENDEEVNNSVGRTHARIWFDSARNAFFILDEGSRYGTRILRGGAVLDVPSGEPDGIELQSGDDVYLGQACLRFTLPV